MRKRDIIVVVAATACLTAGGLFTLLLGHREYSANENRYLTQFPSIHLDEVLKGKTQEDIVGAFNDQFPGRDLWTGAATGIKKALGYRDVGGVYIGKDHYYFEKVQDQDLSQTDYFQNLRFVSYLAGSKAADRVTAMLVPSPGTILSKKLPAHAVLYDSSVMYDEAESLLKELSFVDLRESFLQADAANKHIYFHTDHHWTSYGAYLGYQAYTSSLGNVPRDYQSYEVTPISDRFYGTLYSKALDAAAAPDQIAVPLNLPPMQVVCDGKEMPGLYDETKQHEKDKYAVYFGGNYGEVQIHMTSPKTKNRLLVIKDSFANSMVPYLLEDYEEVRMLDLRYFKGSVREYLKKNDFQEILVLFEMTNFAQDTHLNLLMKNNHQR